MEHRTLIKCLKNELSMEEWRDTFELGDKYEVSNLGRIRNKKTGRILKPYLGKTGYYFVVLSNRDIQKNIKVHRLVALAFIDNPSNLPIINHKDEDRTNNNSSNLEWCDYKYNNSYGSRIAKFSESRRGIANTWNRKRVSQYSKEGKLLNTFESISEACEKSGINNIQACCNGGRVKSAGGFIWKYAED